MNKKIYISIFLSMIFLSYHSNSQEFIDTEGKDFWVTFMPNYHNQNSINITDSLYIFISSKVPTRGEIIYKDRSSNEYLHEFEITDPLQIYTFATTFWEFELLGFNNSGSIISNNQNERIAKQSFHITSDDEITVFALSQASMTSEANLVLPTDALGEEYYVLTYNSDFRSQLSQATPSQFAIVASEDNTDITIRPSAPTRRNGLNDQNISLNRGDVYLVQSDITNSNRNGDLSGSFIQSSKPIAVFAGQQRAAIPSEVTLSSSRDFLVEQMIPIRSWGKNAIVVPFEQPNRVTTVGNDIVRVMAANDNTVVTISGVTYNIDAGKFFEFPLTKALFVEANNQILVMQYKKSANARSNETSNISDPLMLIVPPVEQYIQTYRVINVQGLTYNSIAQLIKSFNEHYITIVGDSLAINSLYLDGMQVNAGVFNRVENTEYFWANLKVSVGVHNLYSNGVFAAFVYGYGEANSYGYLGGMGMVTLDLTDPVLHSEIDCFVWQGVASDSTKGDSKLKSVIANDITNVDVKVEDFQPYQSIVNFSGELINIYQDGEFTITAIDSSNNITKEVFEIPGLTIGTSSFYDSQLEAQYHLSRLDSNYCFEVTIYNYGKHPININELLFKQNNTFIDITPDNPFLLASGNSQVITLCGFSSEPYNFFDTLQIITNCGYIDISEITFDFSSDTSAPKLYFQSDSCNAFFEFHLTEYDIFDTGIQSVDIVAEDNCKVNYELMSDKLVIVKVEVNNQYEDAFFEFVVTDFYDKETVVNRQIPGFTLSIEQSVFDFEETEIGMMNCKPIQLINYGNFDMIIDDLKLSENIIFSFPQSQLPIILKPNIPQNLTVCYTPYSANQPYNSDTIYIGMNCLYMNIALSGTPIPLEFIGNTKCDVEIAFGMDSIRNGIAVTPMPIIESGIISFELIKQSSVSIDIYNSMGIIVDNIFNSNSINGEVKVNLNATELAAGFYVLVINVGNKRYSQPIIIAK